MGAAEYKDDCDGCKISQGLKERVGGIIELEGDWILNHYSDEDTFLGRMALQPRYHRMELWELTTKEAATLGGNIQKIDIALRQYWSIRFPDDPIERVYVVYFFESVFDKPKPTEFHLHIHLIPRAKSLDPLLRKADGSTIIAWNIHKLGKRRDFPQQYRYWTKKGGLRRKEVEKLMTYLRGCLWKPSAG